MDTLAISDYTFDQDIQDLEKPGIPNEDINFKHINMFTNLNKIMRYDSYSVEPLRRNVFRITLPKLSVHLWMKSTHPNLKSIPYKYIIIYLMSIIGNLGDPRILIGDTNFKHLKTVTRIFKIMKYESHTTEPLRKNLFEILFLK